MRERTSTILTASLAAALAAWETAALAQVQPISKEFPAEQIKLIEVQTELGPVRIAGADSKTVKVDVLDSDPVKCRVTMEVRKRTLLLKAERPKKWLFDSTQCSSGFRVQAPKNLPLDVATGVGSVEILQHGAKASVKSGSGNVKLANISGELNAKLGSGSIEGEGFTKALDLMTGSGAIRLKSLGDSIAAQSGSGEVRLEWTEAPGKGRCDVRTGSGEIALTFPEGSKLSARLLTAAGTVLDDFADTKAKGFRVWALSGSGNISIRKPAPAQK
ncbi:MAG: DUF4097 family beta strand repeat protein [Elusimicrobia bacterium]|nr:DUF4097 family beta strand repeat protein [Elusimicrobiota bacterium]